MTDLTKADLSIGETEVIEHALGLNRSKIANRNFYAAGPVEAAIWDGLIDKGLAFEARSLNPADRVFMVSVKGKALFGVLL